MEVGRACHHMPAGWTLTHIYHFTHVYVAIIPHGLWIQQHAHTRTGSQAGGRAGVVFSVLAMPATTTTTTLPTPHLPTRPTTPPTTTTTALHTTCLPTYYLHLLGHGRFVLLLRRQHCSACGIAPYACTRTCHLPACHHLLCLPPPTCPMPVSCHLPPRKGRERQPVGILTFSGHGSV